MARKEEDIGEDSEYTPDKISYHKDDKDINTEEDEEENKEEDEEEDDHENMWRKMRTLTEMPSISMKTKTINLLIKRKVTMSTSMPESA